MKKVVLSLVVVLALSFISALDITLTKDAYFSGETLQAEIPDIFIENLKLENIAIYEGDNVHKATVEPGIIKSDNKYLYYAVLPQNTGNYVLKIENAKYYSGNQQSSETITKSFSIISANSSYLSFNPGNIYTSSDFSIKVKGYNSQQTITLELPEANFKQTFSLGFGMEKTVFISIASVSGTVKSNILLNGYKIPVVIFGKSSPQKNQTTNVTITEENFEDLIYVDPSSIEANVLSGINFEYSIDLIRETDLDLYNIKVSSSDDEIVLDKEKINITDDNEVLKFTINSKKSLNGSITLEYNDSEIIIPVNITIRSDNSEFSGGTLSNSEKKSCREQKGIICNISNSESCSGSLTSSIDGICCIGKCEAQKSSGGWMWGILILLILIGAGLWVYKKSKENPGVKLGDLFSKKTESFKERMNPPSPPTEIRRGLSKI